MRDFQRSKVYAAELAVFGWRPAVGVSLDDAKRYAERVKGSDYWRKCKGWKRVKISDGRGRGRACYWRHSREVCLPRESRRPWVVIHEMAHCLTDRTEGGNYSPHGGVFVRHYLGLLEEVISPRVAATFARALEAEGARLGGWVAKK